MPRANRRCAAAGCDQLAPCPTHTRPAWSGSDRRASLPADWSAIRAAVLARDSYTCQLAIGGTWPTRTGLANCLGVATEVDHIGRPDDHTFGNLRSVCSACHRRRTQQQSAAARSHT